MESNKKNLSFRLLVLITNQKLEGKAVKLFREGAVPLQYKLHGMGTASSDMMDILGLGSIDKDVLVSLLPKDFADKMLLKLRKALKIGTPGSGIAFTMPLSGTNNVLLHILGQTDGDAAKDSGRKDGTAMTETKCAMIAVVVNQGYSEEVMNAARAAGAGGGTVLHSRRIGDEEALSFWGISVQEEKEIILIIAGAEDKLRIMKAISESCGIRSEAKGLVLSMPIDTVIGLGDGE